jgi:hypothetical protein
VIGGERQVFVGPRSATSDSSSASSSRKTGNDTQSRITLGMCINNATSVVVSRMSNNPVNSFHMNNEVVVRQIFDLAEEMFAEYKNRFD